MTRRRIRAIVRGISAAEERRQELKKAKDIVAVAVLVAIVLLVVAYLRSFYRYADGELVPRRGMTSAEACVANLKQLAAAAEVWSSAHPGEDPTLDALVGPDHYIRILPKCPAGGVYSLSKDGDKFVPHCSIPEHGKRGLAALKRLQ